MKPKPSSENSQIRVGSRASRLAKAQVEEVFSLLSQQGVRVSYAHITFDTKGDLDKKTPLTSSPADDFFTDTIDRALLTGEIDVAVHSAKDLPKVLAEGLEIFALTAALDETDAWVGRLPIAKLTSGAKVGTSSAIRQEAIKNLNPKVQTVSIRGTIEERLKLIEQGKVDGIIVAACALKRLGLEHFIKEVMPWEASPLQGQLAVVGRAGDSKLQELFAPLDVRKRYGRVVLVGAGPGDPDLITVKAIKALKEADCVFYDYLVDARLLDHAPDAEKIFVGKRKGVHTLSQAELSIMLRRKAMEGKRVVRLKSGDPLIFGRGADEITYLSSYHIEVDVVPGISSATGIPSGLGIPLTARGIASSVAFVSGHGEDEKNSDPKPIVIPKVDTVVFLMGLTKLPAIVEALTKAGWRRDTPVAVISQGTKSDEKIAAGTIGNIEQLVLDGGLEPPALIIAGQTVKFMRQSGRRAGSANDHILYLGTNPGKYQSLGHIVHLPMIDITPVKPSTETMKILNSRSVQYDMVILTSRYAVKYFFELLAKEKHSPERFKSSVWTVIGKDTAAALKAKGIIAKVIASPETSEGLFEILKQRYDLKGKKILLPRSALPNPYLKDALTKAGTRVTELTVYKNTIPGKRDCDFDHINKVFFTSPSTVKNFIADYGSIPPNWQILSKGPTTSRALKQAGYESEVLIHG